MAWGFSGHRGTKLIELEKGEGGEETGRDIWDRGGPE